MPRNVRNFWLELAVDGKKSQVATGPAAKDGGFQLVVRQRDNGEVTRAGILVGCVTSEGEIQLTWDGENITTLNTTQR